MKVMVFLVFAVVAVVVVLGVLAHRAAAEECAAEGGSYQVVDRRPVTRWTTVNDQSVPYTEWESVYGCVGVPR